MSNISYCRFQNALNDLEDCYEALGNNENLSSEEQSAAIRLIKLCGDIFGDFEEYGN